jgi:hypothetical protein
MLQFAQLAHDSDAKREFERLAEEYAQLAGRAEVLEKLEKELRRA